MIPAGLDRYPQFILRRGKLPVDYRTAQTGNAHDPGAWLAPAQALTMARIFGPEYGVGFVFTPNDPFFFVDIDNCLLSDGSGWSPLALQVLGWLKGAAIEISQSGRGLHVFGSGVTPAHGCKNTELGLELYTENRFVALTGTGLTGKADTDLSPWLPGFISSYFPPSTAQAPALEWTTEPVPEWTGPEKDTDLITKARASKSVFGGKASFAQLWRADANALAKSYPPQGEGPYDASSADAALAQHLAFWTGNNCERILSLMRQSGLTRDKWDREDYLRRTILGAVARQTLVYSVVRRVPIKRAGDPLGDVTGSPQRLAGYQYLGPEAQLEHFQGCIYVQDQHRIFVAKSGAILKPEQFNATYGGYVLQIDDTGKKTTTKPWEAFTGSQTIRWPKAEGMCFRPRSPTGALFQEEGRVLVNTYVPIVTPRQAGDPAPFLGHLQRMLPDGRDQQILLAYMAACVQHIGTKFQWAPLIQGVEGNGKTLLTRCVAAAVGKRYTHYPNAADLDNRFNGWLLRKLFIGVEDVYVSAQRQALLETLKPMITGGDGLEIQLKGIDQITADICANFMLNSNHRDAIRKTKNDRRFAVFFTKQQEAGDLARDGMTGGYFPQLYTWLRTGGYAVVTNYLATYLIPAEFDPAVDCHRAPETSSTIEAIAAGLGGIEQEIAEAISEERPGFRGGWVSSQAVEALLQNMGTARSVPQRKRRELLQALGFDWHPALANGRVNNPFEGSGGTKPILYSKKGHPNANIQGSVLVVKTFQEAQTIKPQPRGPHVQTQPISG